MEILFLLIGISLLMAGAFLYLFFRASDQGQFDDTDSPGVRILIDDRPVAAKGQEEN